MSTSVYKHTFPNGKLYIGIADNPLSRWNNGAGYSDNPDMYADIRKFGWDNIKHEILKSDLSREDALSLEEKLIIFYDSENSEKGYNRTCFSKGLNALSENAVEIKRPNPNVLKKTSSKPASYKCVDGVTESFDVRRARCWNNNLKSVKKLLNQPVYDAYVEIMTNPFLKSSEVFGQAVNNDAYIKISVESANNLFVRFTFEELFDLEKELELARKLGRRYKDKEFWLRKELEFYCGGFNILNPKSGFEYVKAIGLSCVKDDWNLILNSYTMGDLRKFGLSDEEYDKLLRLNALWLDFCEREKVFAGDRII